MSARERCHNCDHPLATEADHNARGCDRCARFDATCPHASLCWSAFAMPCPPVDWRARALAAVTALAGRGGLGVVAVVGPDDAPFPEDALRGLVAALDAYAATDGQPWAERIEARKRVDEARAAVARMEGGR